MIWNTKPLFGEYASMVAMTVINLYLNTQMTSPLHLTGVYKVKNLHALSTTKSYKNALPYAPILVLDYLDEI